MRNTVSLVIVSLIVLLTLSMHAPQVKASNGSEIQLTTNPYGDWYPEWSPDGSKIVYFAFDSSCWYRHIWIMDSDGSNKRQLTFGNVLDEYPAFSSDGLKIIFSSYRGDRGYADLMVMNVDGSGITRLTYGPEHYGYFDALYSIDDKKVVFEYNTPGTSYVATMDLSDMIPHPLTLGAYGRWESEDQEIIFSTLRPNAQIAIMNSDGSNLRLITNYVDRYPGRPDLSPDGERIVFDIVEADGITQDVYIMTKDGNDVTRLTYDERSCLPIFSPQGDKILFLSERTGSMNIWVMPTPQFEVSATIDLDPDILNLKSNGEWITCYMELPNGYDVNDIDVGSIKLTVNVRDFSVDPEAPIAIGDYDGDGILDLMVKFDRASIVSCVNAIDFNSETGNFKELTFTITGKVAGVLEKLTGSDTIMVIIK